MKLKRVVVSAPGKLILHGEHAVVYGKLALATSVDLRCTMYIEPAERDGTVSLRLPGLMLEAHWPCDDLSGVLQAARASGQTGPWSPDHIDNLAALAKKGMAPTSDDDGQEHAREAALITFLHLYTAIYAEREDVVDTHEGRTVPPLSVVMTSELPIGAGLGSSAAFSACLAAGLLLSTQTLSSATLTKEHVQLVDKWAFEGERIIHGNPSGLDNTMACHGGAVLYKPGQVTILEKFPELNVLVVNTKVPKSTKHLVEGVRQLRIKLPKILDPILDAIGNLTTEAAHTYEQLAKVQDGQQLDGVSQESLFTTIMKLVEINQDLLQAIGVSHPQLEEIAALAKQRPNMVAKLTGAGGGGCALVLLTPGCADEDVQWLKSELGKRGFDVYQTRLGAAGVTVEELQ